MWQQYIHSETASQRNPCAPHTKLAKSFYEWRGRPTYHSMEVMPNRGVVFASYCFFFTHRFTSFIFLPVYESHHVWWRLQLRLVTGMKSWCKITHYILWSNEHHYWYEYQRQAKLPSQHYDNNNNLEITGKTSGMLTGKWSERWLLTDNSIFKNIAQ